MTRAAFTLVLLVGALIVGPVVIVLAYVMLHRNEWKEVRQ